MALMRQKICEGNIEQAFRGFIAFLIWFHHRFSGADHPRLSVDVGSERQHRTLDLRSQTGQADFPRARPNDIERIPLTASGYAISCI